MLALTFTNKAAAEMKERIGAIVADARDMWVCTFHAMCARILRIDGERLGYGHNFTIYDASDALTVVKDCLAALDVSKDFLNPRAARAMISRAKNAGIAPDRFAAVYGDGDVIRMAGYVYKAYEETLRASNALDFDDLLLKVLALLHAYPDVLKKYQTRFQYIMVDEYQDTNKVQYEIVHLLAQGSGNLFVVGDDDQSIYGWRGADITNILEFEKDYPGATVIRLEQNYRSHQHILNAANEVIKNNDDRLGKKLWSCIETGQKPLEFQGQNDDEEAQFVAAKVDRILREGKYAAGDIAVLYRVNSQSRRLEVKLKERGVPYMIYGGLSFYERKEIKDIIAYLNILCNENADLCFLRAVQTPKRGIGKVTLDKLRAYAAGRGVSMLAACRSAEAVLPGKAAVSLKGFAAMIDGIRADMASRTVLETVERVMRESGLQQAFASDTSPEGRMRALNVEEFLTEVADFDRKADDGATLDAFLERNALISDIDTVGEADEAIMLMTLHSAKGLEFPVVFIVGMQEGLLPHQMSLSEGNVEEERRLCYVGMTRAKSRLYLTWSTLRSVRTPQGFSYMHSERSRFLDEIPEGCIEPAEVTRPKVVYSAPAKSAFSLTGSRVSAPSFKPDMKSKAQHTPDAFEVGQAVVHPKFGPGIIVSTNGSGEEKIAVVNFDAAGEKKMFVAFAPLKIS
jgi:DNA helicase-2/ATP-dependent DNA helicase PcrA